jgi:hypothetical protein
MKLNPVSLTENQSSSVITSKPAISYHFKTGQRNHAQDQMMFYRAVGRAIRINGVKPSTRAVAST